MSAECATRLVRGAVQLNSLPEVYDQLLSVVGHPDCSAGDIAQVVHEDTVFATRLLRLVNSTLFGFPQRIDSLDQAVILAGSGPLKDLALATSVVGRFEQLDTDLVDMRGFWHHSIACGLCARAIAQERRHANAERHFVTGLLHDVGRLVMLMRAPEQMHEVLERDSDGGTPACEAEAELLGCNHTEVGAALMRKWNLPAYLQECTRYHHAPLQAPQFALEAAVVHVAEVITASVGLDDVNPVAQPLHAAAVQLIGLEPPALRSIVAEVESQLQPCLQSLLSTDHAS